MANPEHLQILKEGAKSWNRWKSEHSEIIPDLAGADLRRAHLSGANLSYVNLSGAHLSGARLKRADLRGARLGGASLGGAALGGANLRDADLTAASLINADLASTDLVRARLRGARLDGADLRHANISGADISGTDFSGAEFGDANFTGVWLSYTKFTDNDLSNVKGLDAVRYFGPSSIGIDTIYKSQGRIPEIFLRGCGVPEAFITYMHSLTVQPIQFYSCFISYSSKDQEFADRLHTDLQAKGVRVWFAPHDLPIGARIRPAIDESIRLHDKLLLVLSEHSVSSQWVEQEVETALAREREQEGKTVLFPIRIDDSVMEIKSGWPALLKNTRNVGDFTNWKDHDSYREAFDRLLRDLRAGA
jgi:hypothetical protein